MGALADALRNGLKTEGQEEEDSWTLIRTALANGDGLEQALQNTSAPKSLVKKIVALTWATIAEDDLALLLRSATGQVQLPLSALIDALFRSTRVAEYAADIARHVHVTGFVPGIIRRREGAEKITVRLGSHQSRVVRIWKVHGSLDWFEDLDAQVICLPLSRTLPDGLQPLIVTPGVSKYERTHDEPFRTVIQGADAALEIANSVLCVGYGFRDSHIQPKLAERCRQKNVPVVILARTLTAEAKNFLKSSAGAAFLAMEKCDDGTRAFTREFVDGTIIEGRDLWSFDQFNELVL